MYINAIKIETLLAERGITKVNLSERSGLSPQSISAVVRRGTCQPKTAGKIAAALGVPVITIVQMGQEGC